MSTKASKRRTRRINTNDEESEKKNDEPVEMLDDNKSTLSTDTEKDNALKDLKTDVKENGDKSPKSNEKSSKSGDKTSKSSEKSPKSKAVLEAKIEENCKEKEENVTIVEEKTNGQTENGTTSGTQNSIDDTCDMEPLVLVDTEEEELHFQSETASEASEIEKSPVLNRCQTRRSQTRSMTTPKTPKSLDFNGETEKGLDLKASDIRLQPTVEEENDEKSENVSVASIDVSIGSSFSEKTQDTDITNASTIANLGDTTRNLDITTTTVDETISASPFVDLAKDKSYGETLRCLSGRRNLRNVNYQPRFYNSTIELHSNDVSDGLRKYSTLRSASLKRKLDHDSPGKTKKPKTSPGFFSYLKSPFWSKGNRTDISSSTPKLTGFKYVHQGSNPIDEVEKTGIDVPEGQLVKLGDKIEDKNVQPRKWCSVM